MSAKPNPYLYSERGLSTDLETVETYSVLLRCSRELAVCAEVQSAPPGNPRRTNVGGGNAICHLFPTRHIYAHKSFPTLCLAGFLVITGHLCHSHPVHCLGNTLTHSAPWSHRVFGYLCLTSRPTKCVSTV